MPYSSKTTLTQWMIFNAVIDCGGYLKASEKLNRSHSSLHHAVRKLQSQLGVELIKIDGKKPRLTDVGKVMRRRSLQLLKDASEIENLAEHLGEGWETEITIAIENIFPNKALMPILNSFHNSNPVTRLKITDVVLNGAVEAIVNATADIVISPIVPAGFLGTPLVHISMYPCTHKNHPLAKLNRPVTQKDLMSHLQIVISDTAKGPDRVPTGWLRPEQRWTVSDFHHAKDILKSGKGFCWIPEHFIAEDIRSGNLSKIRMLDELSRSVILYLVIPKRDQLGPGAELLTRLILEEGEKHLPPLPEYSD